VGQQICRNLPLDRDGLRLPLGRRADTSATPHAACTLWLDVSGIDDLHSTIEGKVRIE
jgi:hypothetical protein